MFDREVFSFPPWAILGLPLGVLWIPRKDFLAAFSFWPCGIGSGSVQSCSDCGLQREVLKSALSVVLDLFSSRAKCGQVVKLPWSSRLAKRLRIEGVEGLWMR